MPDLPIPEDDQDRKLLADVDKYGWHVAKISEMGSTPGWAFSIGLYRSFNHPEVVVFGLQLEMLHQLINNIGSRIRGGSAFLPGTRSEDLLEGYACSFRAVHAAWYEPFLGHANWFYRGVDYPAVQLLWPDRSGALPDDPDFDPELISLQPLLWHATAHDARVEDLLDTLDT